MSNKNNSELLLVSLEYGQGYSRMVDMEKKVKLLQKYMTVLKPWDFDF